MRYRVGGGRGCIVVSPLSPHQCCIVVPPFSPLVLFCIYSDEEEEASDVFASPTTRSEKEEEASETSVSTSSFASSSFSSATALFGMVLHCLLFVLNDHHIIRCDITLTPLHRHIITLSPLHSYRLSYRQNRRR